MTKIKIILASLFVLGITTPALANTASAYWMQCYVEDLNFDLHQGGESVDENALTIYNFGKDTVRSTIVDTEMSCDGLSCVMTNGIDNHFEFEIQQSDLDFVEKTLEKSKLHAPVIKAKFSMTTTTIPKLEKEIDCMVFKEEN